jgi:hypothetical protein
VADMSRQLDVLSPGANGAVEPISRAIAMREEIDLQKAAMELQREEAKARQELMKTELQQREMERITSVEEGEKQRQTALQEGTRNREHDQQMLQARSTIEKEIMAENERFAREREQRDFQRAEDRQRRGLDAYKEIQAENRAAALKHNEIVANMMAANTTISALNGEIELDLGGMQDMVSQMAAARAKSQDMLRGTVTAASAGLESFAEQFDQGRVGRVRTQTGERTTRIDPRTGADGGPIPVYETTYDPAAPGEAILSNMGMNSGLTLEQVNAIKGVYRTLVSVPSTGAVPEPQAAAIRAAVESAKGQGVTPDQIAVVLEGMSTAMQAQAAHETGPLGDIYKQNLAAFSRASSFGITAGGEEWTTMQSMPARIVSAMRSLEVPEDDLIRMLGPLYNDEKFMAEVREMQARTGRLRTEMGNLRGLTVDSLNSESMSQMGPSPEALEALTR